MHARKIWVKIAYKGLQVFYRNPVHRKRKKHEKYSINLPKKVQVN